MIKFDCAAYRVVGHDSQQEVIFQEQVATQHIAKLLEVAKEMEQALKEWEAEVKTARSHHYELNYYSMIQLQKLRKGLGCVRQNPGKSIDPMILALLESVSPEVTFLHVCNGMSYLDRHSPAPLDIQDSSSVIPEQDFLENPIDIQSLADSPFESTASGDPTTAFESTVASDPNRSSSPSLASDKKQTVVANPQLTENDLSDTQKSTFTNLVDYQDYPRLLVLKALEECPNANVYDIQDWCDENESIFDFHGEESEQDQNTSSDIDDSFSESSSDDEGNESVFIPGAWSLN